jgi:hydrogenase expression/formation protein HypC
VSTELPLHQPAGEQPAGDQAPSAPEPQALQVPECHDGVCITCSDEAVEVTVMALLDDGLARVDTGEGIEEISVALVEAGPGDRVLVHAKEAIGVMHASAE